MPGWVYLVFVSFSLPEGPLRLLDSTRVTQKTYSLSVLLSDHVVNSLKTPQLKTNSGQGPRGKGVKVPFGLWEILYQTIIARYRHIE